MNNIHPNFIGSGISAVDTSCGIITGRPYGGVSVLWRKTLSNLISIVKYDDARLIGCMVKTNDIDSLYVNVYLPYQCDDNYDSYVYYLGKLSAIIDESPTSNITVVGDFNAKLGSPFEDELQSVVRSSNMHISDFEYFGYNSDKYTYVSDAHMSTSWLDHYICSTSMHRNISYMTILDKLPSSDHLPIAATFTYPDDLPVPSSVSDAADNSNKACLWYTATPEMITRYSHDTMIKLNSIHIPVSALSCTDARCQDSSHTSDLDHLYTDICASLHTSGGSCIPSSGCNTASQLMVPGWNDHVRDVHTEARHAYVTWRDFGKPRSGPVCELMRTTRLRFKYALRHCQAAEDTARADAIAKSLATKDMAGFWKSIKNMNNKYHLPNLLEV